MINITKEHVSKDMTINKRVLCLGIYTKPHCITSYQFISTLFSISLFILNGLLYISDILVILLVSHV